MFFLNAAFQLHTHLLAVKLFRPSPELGKLTGKVLMLWANQVFEQFGLNKKDFAAATTDGGQDVRTGAGDTWPRLWCICHLLNRATIDGTGCGTSGNELCKELVDGCKKVAQLMNQSQRAKVSLP